MIPGCDRSAAMMENNDTPALTVSLQACVWQFVNGRAENLMMRDLWKS